MDNVLGKWLKKADEGGYAIPHFNCADSWDLMAVLLAAEEEASPVIVATIPKVLDLIPPEVLGGMGVGAAHYSCYPVFMHLDHSKTVSLCHQCVDSGYTSVMIDGSLQPLEENIRMVKEVVDYAGPRGVNVEGELGKIMGRDYEGNFDGGDYLVDVDEVIELVQKTGVDSLAVGIGTAHGFYKGTPKLNFERLTQVNRAVETPLVLHGGTGIPGEDVRRAIREGINKVNVGTQIKYTNVNTFHKLHTMGAFDENIHTVDLGTQVIDAIKDIVKNWIRICMSDGKA